jgi:hypothetical protein
MQNSRQFKDTTYEAVVESHLAEFCRQNRTLRSTIRAGQKGVGVFRELR